MSDRRIDLNPTLLINAYTVGVFPMADSAAATDVYWVDPHVRGVLPLDGFRLSRSLRKRLRRPDHAVTINRAFDDVVAGCADRDETWINTRIRGLYSDLHRLGYGHSVEIWMDGALAGGLYGVALGGAFFGESMFSRRPDGSKMALAHLVARLRAGGFTLLDTQFVTEHLRGLGAIEISRKAYHDRLDAALPLQADFSALDPEASIQEVLQLITQTS